MIRPNDMTDISLAGNAENVVVFVDDDPTLRGLVASTLKLRGISVVTAADGDEGLAVMKVLSPKVVLLDVRMPGGLSGPEVCRKMREELALTETFVIFLTTQDACDIRADAQAAGADVYMCKPFDPDTLVHMIERLLSAGRDEVGEEHLLQSQP